MPAQAPAGRSDEGRVSRTGVRGFSPSRLRDARSRAKLTLETLSIRSGVGAAAIGHWETGRAVPSPKLLIVVADALNLRLADLTVIKPGDLRLADLRARAGRSQADVAEHLGVSRGTASALDRGYTPLHEDDAQRLAAFYDVTVDELHAAWQRSRNAR